jgi:ankyrin repeat protein
MHRGKTIGLLLLLLLVGLVGTPIWLTYRQARQEGLNRALIAAIEHRDEPAGLAALHAGADPNSREDSSNHSLSFWQSLRRLFTGIWRHGKPSASQQGQTALMLALYSDVEDESASTPVLSPLIQALVVRGAEVNARDGLGETTLILAAMKEPTDTVRALLNKGAEVNARDSDQFLDTALQRAAFMGNTETTKVLLDRGAEVNARDRIGATALLYAVANGSTETTRVLLGRGADVNTRIMFSGGAALYYAKANGHTAIVRLLKQAGAKE